ncbi:BQ5605_C015g07869 [Microbotryum silenes-dioicae]|uniref:BQ5605_C015g07869 protein n=1 Tax=Microbotryum silenes-dioicae TaxID=796604 RepID=A0A2X0LX78_9BASI|nr:BQ5605_C015g07869 [Microbotryum silenes-dioicae]
MRSQIQWKPCIHYLAWILCGYLLYSSHSSSRSSQVETPITCPQSEAGLPSVVERQKEENEATLAKTSLVESLLTVPAEDLGTIAICASIHNEARFINEWLLYNRAMGVDRFYLYDTGSTDNTMDMLKPWIATGTVHLHVWNKNQGGNFQINSLEHCSRYHATKTQWILDCDVDEFYVPTPVLTGSPNRALRIDEMPEAPLRSMLASNWLYQNADAVVVSRVTWKNAGVDRLPEDGSVLKHQTLRDIYHNTHYEKLEFTKVRARYEMLPRSTPAKLFIRLQTLIHTRGKQGWVLPGAHLVRHDNVPRSRAKIITVNGHPVTLMNNSQQPTPVGTFFDGRHPTRAFEPLVMYHYIGRGDNLHLHRASQNCLQKFANAQKVRKGGWRDQAGAEGCKVLDVYQKDLSWRPIHEPNGFYAAAVQDNGMANSWYGQHMESLIQIVNDMAKADQEPVRAEKVDPHPDMVQFWLKNGMNPDNGLPL